MIWYAICHMASSKDLRCKCICYLDLLVYQFQDLNYCSLDKQMDVGVAHVDAQQDLGPVPDNNSGSNEV